MITLYRFLYSSFLRSLLSVSSYGFPEIAGGAGKSYPVEVSNPFGIYIKVFPTKTSPRITIEGLGDMSLLIVFDSMNREDEEMEMYSSRHIDTFLYDYFYEWVETL